MKIRTLNDLFVDQLKDIYDAEKQLVKALPKMARGANSDALRQAFDQHLEETRHHVDRLEEVFNLLGLKAKGKTCEAMEGLVSEGKDILSEDCGPQVLDAGLICAAQKVEHYEMSAYGTLRAWAQQLSMTQAANLLEATLREEEAADRKLNELALGGVNRAAEQPAAANV
jgi:ferritin-like metal-binding protein YciE